MDFIKGLPLSEGYDTILVIIFACQTWASSFLLLETLMLEILQ